MRNLLGPSLVLLVAAGFFVTLSPMVPRGPDDPDFPGVAVLGLLPLLVSVYFGVRLQKSAATKKSPDASPSPQFVTPRYTIGRSTYFCATFLLVLAQFGMRDPRTFAFFFLTHMVLAAFRLRHIGASLWFLLAVPIPIVSTVMFYRMAVYPAGYARSRQADSSMRWAQAASATVLVGLFILISFWVLDSQRPANLGTFVMLAGGAILVAAFIIGVLVDAKTTRSAPSQIPDIDFEQWRQERARRTRPPHSPSTIPTTMPATAPDSVFDIEIPEAHSHHLGVCELPHATPYTIVLVNRHSELRCDAKVWIDGYPVGVWRIAPQSRISLERPIKDLGRFTFFQAGTPEAKQAAIDPNNPALGIVRVKFMPEARRPLLASAPATLATDRGGTGLSGHSQQDFHSASPIHHDEFAEIIREVRLVPLPAIRPLRST